MKGEWVLPMLPNIAIQENIFPNIKHSQVSIGEVCDAGCTVTFKMKELTFVYKYNIILQGWINHRNKLCYLPLSVKN